MIQYALTTVIILIVLVLTSAVIRTVFQYPLKKHSILLEEEIKVDMNHAVTSLQEMIRIQTVSQWDETKIDETPFENFRAYLRTRYPLIHEHCEFTLIPPRGIVYHLKGTQAIDPTVLMSHYDVVSVSSNWSHDPFGGELINQEIWGRGTLDTKGTLCSIMEALESKLAQHQPFKNDLYLCFSGDEEIMGPSAPAIVSYLESRQIKPRLVLDEGGAVVEGVFPGVSAPCGVIGVAEKGVLNLEFTVKGQGGHASTPPKHTPLGILATAIQKVEHHSQPTKFTPVTREMFETLGGQSNNFFIRLLFTNLWCFGWLIKHLLTSKGGEMKAFFSTTVAFTMAQGSKMPNVLPDEAKIVANIRIASYETVDQVVARLTKIINDPRVHINVGMGMNPSPTSQTSGSFEQVKKAVEQTWNGSIVAPYLMMAASDSRHYHRISDSVYRFSAMALSKEQRSYIHADNERITLLQLEQCVRFYHRILKDC